MCSDMDRVSLARGGLVRAPGCGDESPLAHGRTVTGAWLPSRPHVQARTEYRRRARRQSGWPAATSRAGLVPAHVQSEVAELERL
jgi:hypothetical protein